MRIKATECRNSGNLFQVILNNNYKSEPSKKILGTVELAESCFLNRTFEVKCIQNEKAFVL